MLVVGAFWAITVGGDVGAVAVAVTDFPSQTRVSCSSWSSVIVKRAPLVCQGINKGQQTSLTVRGIVNYLLPGKLRYREVSASFNYNYIGRLLLPVPVEKFPLVGLNSAMLLVAEDGGFTLEINGSEKELYLLSGQQFLMSAECCKETRQHSLQRDHRWLQAGLGQPFGIADRHVLHTTVAVH